MKQLSRHSILMTSAAALVLACGGATEPAMTTSGASHDETVGAPSTEADRDGNGGNLVGGNPVGGTPVRDVPLLDEANEPPEPGPEPAAPRSCLAEPDCVWSTRAPMPDRRRGQAAVAIGGSVYVFGGEGAGDVDSLSPGYVPGPARSSARFSTVRAYDPGTDSWVDQGPLPHGLYVLTAHELAGKVYVFGGYGESGFDATVQEYDPASNSWQLREPLPTPRYIFVSAVVAGKAYVIGGHGPGSDAEAVLAWDYLSNVDIFDPVLGWSSGAPSPTPLAGGASCAMDSRIFVFGGEANNLTSVYDVASNSWTQATPSSVARNGHSCVRVGSAFYLIGGRDSQGSLDLVEKYEPATDTWQTLDPMPTPRHWFGVAALAEDIFVFGGDQEPAYTGPPNYSLSNVVEVLGAL